MTSKQDALIPAIYDSMSKIMAGITFIGKDQTNKQQGFQYRGIDDIYNSLHKLFAEHGVFTTSTILEKTREERTTKTGGILAFTCLRIRYRFYASDGSYIETDVEGEGMDSGDKSSNKAMAIAHKYALLQVFMIPTDEIKDPDAETHEIINENVATAIEYLDLYLAGTDDVTFDFMEFWGPLGGDMQTSVFSSFPKGTITKYKKAAREMENAYNNACNLAANTIAAAHTESDSVKALESWGDFGGYGKRIVWNKLNNVEQDWLKEVNK